MKDKKTNVKDILTLFLSFLKIGAFTFGGGYAMIPLVQREASERHKWITSDEMLEMIAISESTPGPIAINMATFVGYRVGGFFGALFATLGVVIPSFLIILLISLFFNSLLEYKIVRYAFAGVRAAVVALMVNAVIKLFRGCKDRNLFFYIVAAGAFALSSFGVTTIYVIIAAALVGIVYALAAKKKSSPVSEGGTDSPDANEGKEDRE